MRTSASSGHAMCLPIAQTHWAALRVPAFRAIAAMASIVKVSLRPSSSLRLRLVVIVVSISMGIMTDQPSKAAKQRSNQQSIQLKVQMIVVAVLYFRQRRLSHSLPTPAAFRP